MTWNNTLLLHLQSTGKSLLETTMFRETTVETRFAKKSGIGTAEGGSRRRKQEEAGRRRKRRLYGGEISVKKIQESWKSEQGQKMFVMANRSTKARSLKSKRHRRSKEEQLSAALSMKDKDAIQNYATNAATC